jgi:hypothetical protein
MRTGEITVFESKLHGVKLWGAKVGEICLASAASNRWLEMERWCTEQFGDHGSIWDTEITRWYMNNRSFFFRDGRDLTMFLLKWR